MDYISTWRSNYVLVKPECEEDFREIARFCGARVVEGGERGEGKFRIKRVRDGKETPPQPKYLGIISNSSSFSEMYTTDEGKEIRTVNAIAGTLVKGQVMVIQEAGAEGERYVSGFSLAFNHTGAELWINLNDVYEKAAKKFHVAMRKISVAEY